MEVLDDLEIKKEKKYWRYLFYNHKLFFENSDNKVDVFTKINILYSFTTIFIVTLLDFFSSVFYYGKYSFPLDFSEFIFDNVKYNIVFLVCFISLYHLVSFFADYFSQNYLSRGSVAEYKKIFIRIIPIIITFYLLLRLYIIFVSTFNIYENIDFLHISYAIKYLAYFFLLFSYILFCNGVKHLIQLNFFWSFIIVFFSIVFSSILTILLLVILFYSIVLISYLITEYLF